MPAGDLPVSLAVVPFAIAGKPGAAVAVVARVDHEAGLAPGSVVEFVAVAFDDKWKQVTSVTQRFMLPPAGESVLFPETAARLNLPPGRYEVRAALRSTADNRTGSVYTSATVPDFAREPLSLSGMAIEPQSGGAAMLKDLASIVPARMTTGRVFSSGERVAIVARVYQGRAKTLVPVRVTVQIVDTQDRTVIHYGNHPRPDRLRHAAGRRLPARSSGSIASVGRRVPPDPRRAHADGVGAPRPAGSSLAGSRLFPTASRTLPAAVRAASVRTVALHDRAKLAEHLWRLTGSPAFRLSAASARSRRLPQAAAGFAEAFAKAEQALRSGKVVRARGIIRVRAKFLALRANRCLTAFRMHAHSDHLMGSTWPREGHVVSLCADFARDAAVWTIEAGDRTTESILERQKL